MAKKIIRGTVIGGFLGIVLGLALSYVTFFVRTLNQGEETVSEQIAGSPYVSVMSMDNQAAAYYDMGDALTDDYAGLDIMPDSCLPGVEVDVNPPACDELEDVILRFHVRANSNSTEDLELKYEVRDAVLKALNRELGDDYSRDEVLAYITEHTAELEDIAREVLEDAGCDYPVNVYMSNDYFPIRQYGELVLPAGNYQALRIDIGAAEGENFWCILYPMMCYTLDTGAVVSQEDEETLEEMLSEEDYRKLFVDCDTGDNTVEVRFKLLDWIEDMLD